MAHIVCIACFCVVSDDLVVEISTVPTEKEENLESREVCGVWCLCFVLHSV